MVWFVVLAVCTAGLAIGLPPDPQTLHSLHISNVVYRLAVLVLLVPYGIIWYASFYAFAKLHEYSHVIKGSKDGKGFKKIMYGMGVLAFGLVVPTGIALIFQSIVRYYPGFKPVSVIIDNYISLIVVVVAFTFFSDGTRLLGNISKSRPGQMSLRIFALFFITLSVAFTYLVIHFHIRHPHSYYLTLPWLVLTFIIPNLYGWFMALLSAFEFRLYATNANGLLYRRALRRLAYGVLITIAGFVAIGFVDNTFLVSKVSSSLGSLILLEYALLAIIAIGLIFMAYGTKQLKRIEEV
jgi:hypothetical protein